MHLPHLCKDCGGKCCTNPFLTTYEYTRLYEAAGDIKMIEARPRYVPGLQAWIFEAGICPGLTGTGCILPYDDRPLICKTYPFIGYRMANGQIALLLAVRTCPAWKEFGEQFEAVYKEYEELTK